MLYVESIEFRGYSEYDFISVPCLNYDRENANTGIVYVILRDSETGCVESFSTADSAAAFERALKERNPYGYTTPLRYTHSFILTAVDKLSLQFLDLVESVEPILFDGSDTAHQLWSRYFVFDEFGTLFEEDCYFNSDAFTLFQIVSTKTDGWIGDRYYVVTDGDGAKGLCVTFTDLSKVRAFIAKAVTIGRKHEG